MKFLRRLIIRLILMATLALLGWMAYLYLSGTSRSLFSFSAGSSLQADPTPMRIQAIRNIGQWEFLSIDDEEVVDTVRRRWIGTDDHLVRIYRGTLRIGIDFRQCNDDWALAYSDTVKVRIPEVRLLDNLFIDEARARSFYESGRWDASVRNDLRLRAEQAMRRRCLTPENMQTARQTACEQLQRFFLSLGYAHVIFVDEDQGE
ncbi:MAG: DUF4230 domain-containing protein [Bacteroidaceae bacterium]